MRKVRVAVTADHEPSLGQRGHPHHVVKAAYVEAVRRAGGLPVVLPCLEPAEADAYLDGVDAVVFTGGGFDVPPSLYGEEPHPRLGETKPVRSTFELALLERALGRGLPVLGICGGMQLLNVARGGSLFQDLPSQRPGSVGHLQDGDARSPIHSVDVAPGTQLAAIVGLPKLEVNSTHHQAVSRLGRGLRVAAHAPDGLVEAIEGESGGFALGVQWHPEQLIDRDDAQLAIYRALIAAALG